MCHSVEQRSTLMDMFATSMYQVLRKVNPAFMWALKNRRFAGQLLLGGALVMAVVGCQLSHGPEAEGPVAGPPVSLSAPDTGRTALSTGLAAPSPRDIATLDGKSVSLKTFQGKVVILDFWATWCGPCRKSIPKLVELQDRYGKQGLVVLGITNEDDETARPVAAELKMNYTVGADPHAVPEWGESYEVSTLPTMFVIDRKGVIRMHEVGLNTHPTLGTAAKLDALIPQLLAEK